LARTVSQGCALIRRRVRRAPLPAWCQKPTLTVPSSAGFSSAAP